MELIASYDVDWCGDKQYRKSTSCYLFKFLNALISWCAKKQLVVALSTCESEYVAGCLAACQAVWLEATLKEMEIEVDRPIALFIDNKLTINLAKNKVLHGRNKHIEANFHLLREQVNREALKIVHGSTELQLTNLFTKPLKVDRFIKVRSLIGMVKVET